MLMRPTVETSRDPLRAHALPSTREMELDYRTSSGSQRACFGLARYCILCGMFWALVFTVALRVLAIYSSSPLFLAIASLVGLACAVLSFLETASLARALFLLGLGPGLWALSVASTTAWQAALLFLAAIASLNLGHQITRHHAAWMHANPYLDKPTRRKWSQVWGVSDWPQHLLEYLFFGAVVSEVPACPLERTEGYERARYGLGFAVVLLGFLLAGMVLFLHGAALTRGTWAALTFLAVVVPFGVGNAMQHDSRPTAREVVESFREAVISWATYNFHGTEAPGVFQSPFGTGLNRRRKLVAGMFCIAMVALPIAWYFPIGIFVFGGGSWMRAAAKPWPWNTAWEEWQSVKRPHPHQPPRARIGGVERILDSEQERPSLVDASQIQKARIAEFGNAIRSLSSRPESSLWVYARGLFNLDWRIIGSMVLAIVACACAPPILLLSACFAIGSRVLIHHRVTLEYPGSYHMTPRPSLWHAYVQRLRLSAHSTMDEIGRPVRERDHLLVGFSMNGDYPVLIHEPIIREHAHVTGDSGSRKTSLALAPLIAQLTGRPNTSVVVLDLKGDQTLFEAARIAVREANAVAPQDRKILFRWFTNMQDQSTHVFNVFRQRHIQSASLHQKAEILLKSMGMEHGAGYGPEYFSGVHRAVLTAILRNCPEADSFRKIDRYVNEVLPLTSKDAGLNYRIREQAMHLFNVISSLASFDALNITPEDRLSQVVLDRRIDMSDVVRKPHVVYFKMHSLVQEASVREIAKLALFSLLTAASRRGAGDHTVYLIIDEFQQLVSRDVEIILRQARSHGIPTILANQTLSDLKDNQVDLIPIVQGNTRFRQIFSASDVAHQDMLIRASGETIYHMASWGMTADLDAITIKGDETAFNIKEEIGPRLRRNDILAASSQEMQSIVQVTRDGGLTQFGGFLFPMRSLYNISLEEYDRRRHTPWPRAKHHPGTIVPPIRIPRDSKAPARQAGKPQPKPITPLPAAPSPSGAPADPLADLERAVDQLLGDQK